MAASLSNLGIVASERGDFDLATDYFRRALDLSASLAPGSLDHIRGLVNLGIASGNRREFKLAMRSFEEALELLQHHDPESPQIALILGNLGVAASKAGDPKASYRYLERALAIQEAFDKDSLDVAQTLGNLATLDRDAGDLKKARSRLERSLSITTSLAPQSTKMSHDLFNLGQIDRDEGNDDLALDKLTRALQIDERLAPRSSSEVETLQTMADLLKARDPGRAIELLLRAADSLDSQIGKLGSSQEVRADFRQSYRWLYYDLIDLLLQQGQKEKAFHVIERSRARSLLDLLAERELQLERGLPEELEMKRLRLARRYDAIQEELSQASTLDESTVEALLLDLESLRREHGFLMDEFRRASPKLANLRYPQPLDVNAAQRAVEVGTVSLSYVVGDNHIYLFVLTANKPLRVHEIHATEASLNKDVDLFRALLAEDPRAQMIAARRTAILDIGARLYETLLRPAEDDLAESSRLLIVPDGPLHKLPWGALVRTVNQENRFLAQWRPLHTTVSLTLFSDLKQARSGVASGRPVRIAAFGDPFYAKWSAEAGVAGIPDPQVRSAAERGFNFEPLPGTRMEVEGIGSLFPQSVVKYLGRDATEENAKALPAEVSIVHFAAHATLDERIPLNSAVALSMPQRFAEGTENGLLQAWEIFEGLRIRSDLVVLSACDSALGMEAGGEGLIGLTRAFHYAGARSVLASLWKIRDRTTAELMVRFYRHLKEGLPKDEALRATQMEFIRGPIQVTNDKGERVDFDASAPYYWAAFQIYGDWQ